MRRGVVGALALFAVAAGCAVKPAPTLTAFAEDTGANSFKVFDRSIEPPDALVLPLVQDPQNARPSCGAHALASVVNYWNGPGSLDGATLYQTQPPANPAGYSMAELISVAREQDLLASPVRLSEADVIAELGQGRPVLVPVRVPSIYVQRHTAPGARLPGVDVAKNILVHRVGRVSELIGVTMVDHYLLVAGYSGDTFVVLEPVQGYRTIGAEALARYREAFGDAAIVFSAAPQEVSSAD